MPANFGATKPRTQRLYINIDHVATIREARRTDEPDPVLAAHACIAAGAHGITAHLREDRRHIQDRDVERLRAEVDAPFNLEMACTDEMVAIAERRLRGGAAIPLMAGASDECHAKKNCVNNRQDRDN